MAVLAIILRVAWTCSADAECQPEYNMQTTGRQRLVLGIIGSKHAVDALWFDKAAMCTAIGEQEYDMLTTEQRGAVLGALEAIMLDTNFMRLTVAATVDTRREVMQELSALRLRLRK
jgi:hypothetical protein